MIDPRSSGRRQLAVLSVIAMAITAWPVAASAQDPGPAESTTTQSTGDVPTPTTTTTVVDPEPTTTTTVVTPTTETTTTTVGPVPTTDGSTTSTGGPGNTFDTETPDDVPPTSARITVTALAVEEAPPAPPAGGDPSFLVG